MGVGPADIRGVRGEQRLDLAERDRLDGGILKNLETVLPTFLAKALAGGLLVRAGDVGIAKSLARLDVVALGIADDRVDTIELRIGIGRHTSLVLCARLYRISTRYCRNLDVINGEETIYR